MPTNDVSTPDYIQSMREALVPQGRAPLVLLSLRRAAAFDDTFVTACIDCLERKLSAAAHSLDAQLSPLEKLAVHVLMDSSHQEFEK